jgi:hypothetical protein
VHFENDSLVTVTFFDPNNSANSVTKQIFVSIKKKSINIDNDSSLKAKISLQSVLSANKIITSEGILCTANNDGYCSLNFIADTSLK